MGGLLLGEERISNHEKLVGPEERSRGRSHGKEKGLVTYLVRRRKNLLKKEERSAARVEEIAEELF